MQFRNVTCNNLLTLSAVIVAIKSWKKPINNFHFIQKSTMAILISFLFYVLATSWTFLNLGEGISIKIEYHRSVFIFRFIVKPKHFQGEFGSNKASQWHNMLKAHCSLCNKSIILFKEFINHKNENEMKKKRNNCLMGKWKFHDSRKIDELLDWKWNASNVNFMMHEFVR